MKSQIAQNQVTLLDNDDNMRTDLSGVPAAQAVPFTVEPPEEGEGLRGSVRGHQGQQEVAGHLYTGGGRLMDHVHPHQGVGPLLFIALTPAVLTQTLHLNGTYKKRYSVTIIFTAPTSKASG